MIQILCRERQKIQKGLFKASPLITIKLKNELKNINKYINVYDGNVN